MAPSNRVALALLSAALVVGSCVGSDVPTGVEGGSGLIGLALQPALIPSPADAGALPINRIRALVSRQPDNAVLQDVRVDVLPTATAWTLNLNVPAAQRMDVVVLLYLLNVGPSGSEAVQFSGRTASLSIAPGVRHDGVDVDIVRGPLDNLLVTDVAITSFPDTLGVAKSATLSASVAAPPGANPTVFWTSLDPGLITVTDAVATGVSPGTARVVASAGALADTVAIEVVAVPVDSVRVSPDSADVSVSAARTYSVQVFDADGVALTGRSVTWSTGNPSIATVDAVGVVTGVAPGATTVAAMSEGVSDDAIVRVTAGGGPGGAINTWTAGSGGLWSTATNWSLGRAPAPGDTVQLTQGVDYMVTMDVDATIARLAIGGTADVITLAVGDQTLTITEPNDAPGLEILPLGSVQVANGTVNVARVDNYGSFQATGVASLSATDVSNYAQWRVAAGGVLSVSHPTSSLFETSGTLTLESGAGFLLGAGGNFSYLGGSIEGDGGALFFAPLSQLILYADLTLDGPVLEIVDAAVVSANAERLTIGPLSALVLLSDSTQTQVNSRVLNQGTILASGPGSFFTDSLYIESSATLVVDATDAGSWLGTGAVDNSGTIALSGTADVRFGPGSYGASVTNRPGGVIQLLPGGGLRRLDGELVNEGSLLVAAPAELLRESVQGAPFAAQHVNSGTIEIVTGGDLEVVLGGTSPTFTNSGTVTVGDLTTLSVTNLSDGAVNATPTAVLNGTGTVDVTTGSPTGVNQGSIAPGLSAGRLTWLGSVPMGPGGTIQIELDGDTAATGYDQLVVSGTLYLDGFGTLEVSAPSFTPSDGDRFAVITFGARSGTFDTVTLPSIAGITLDTVWTSGQSPDTLYIVATASGPAIRLNQVIGPSGTNADDVDAPGNGVNLVGTALGSGPTTLAAGASGPPTFDFNTFGGTDRTTGFDRGDLLAVLADQTHEGAGLLLDLNNDNSLSGETAQQGFGLHANRFVTFDLAVIRADAGLAADQAFSLTGVTGPTGASPPQSGMSLAVLLDGIPLVMHDVAAGAMTSLAFSEYVGGTGRYLTFVALEGAGLEAQWDHGGFAQVELEATSGPGPSANLNRWIPATGNGNWSDAANWSKAAVPVASDSVVIDFPGTYTVTLDTNTTVLHLMLGASSGTQTLTGTSRVLTLEGASVIGTNGVFSLTTSTVNGSGTLTNEGTGTLTGGSAAVPVANVGTLTARRSVSFTGALTTGVGSTLRVEGVSGFTGVLTVSSGFINNGTILLTDPGVGFGARLIVSSGTLVNAPGGLINSAGFGGSRTLTAQLNNQGAVTVGQALTIDAVAADHVNSGTITLSGGLLQVAQSGSTPSFTNTSTGVVTMSNGWIVSGGTLDLSGGTVGGGGLLTVSNATLDYVPASLPSTVSLNGVTVTGGLTVPAAQTLTLQTSNFSSPVTVDGTLVIRRAVTLGGALLTPGTLRMIGEGGFNGDLTVTNGWTNTGTIELTDVSGFASSLTVSTGSLVNQGSLNVLLGGNGARTLTAALDNQSTVTLSRPLTINGTNATHVNSGTIALTGGALTLTQTGSGSFTNQSTGVLTLTNGLVVNGGTLDLSVGTVSGSGALTMSGGTLTYAFASLPSTVSLNGVTVTGGLTVPAAQTLTLQTSNFSSPVTVDGTLVIRRAVTLGGALLTPGTLRMIGEGGFNGDLTVTNGWTNTGTIELTDVSGFASSLTVSTGSLVNQGSLNVLLGGNGARTLTAALDNQSTVTLSRPLTINGTNATHVNSGTIALTGGALTLTQTGSGSFTNQSTGVLTLTNGLVVNGGTLDLSVGTVSGSGALTMSGGTLTYAFASLPSTVSLNGVTVTGGLTVPAAQTLTLQTSNFSSPVTVDGTLVIRRAVTLGGALLTPGTLRMIGEGGFNGDLTVTNGWTNTGTIELTDVSGFASSLTVSTGSLVNQGSLNVLLGGNGARTLAASLLDNAGTVTISRSTTVTGALDQRNALTVPVSQTLAMSGLLRVFSGSVTTVNGTLTAGGGCASVGGGGPIVGSGSYPACP